MLNQQGRTVARGLPFTGNLVGNTHRHWHVPRYEPPANQPTDDLLSIKQAAAVPIGHPRAVMPVRDNWRA
jgi:hypothetical protein